MTASHPKMENNSTVTTAHEFKPGNIGYLLTCTALVWLMIPGVGYFYSGMARMKSALSLIMLSCWSMAIVFVQVLHYSTNSDLTHRVKASFLQWFLIGYSLTFSRSASPFIGNFENIFLKDVSDKPNFLNPEIPDMLFCIYQAMFASITPGETFPLPFIGKSKNRTINNTDGEKSGGWGL